MKDTYAVELVVNLCKEHTRTGCPDLSLSIFCMSCFFVLSSNFCLIYLLGLVVMEVNHEVMKTKVYPERLSKSFLCRKVVYCEL